MNETWKVFRSQKFPKLEENFSFFFLSRSWSFNKETYLASSASSPASTSHTRQLSLTPSAQQRQLQIRRRLQQHKMATENILRIQHQNRSDPSSSDDGMPQPPIMHHRVAAGIHMAHNQTIAPAGLISEAIELKPLTSIQSARHRSVDHEDSVKTTSTISPNTCSSGRDTIETNLSLTTHDEGSYKRSRSYHGKGSVLVTLSLLLKTRCWWCRSLSLSLYLSSSM